VLEHGDSPTGRALGEIARVLAAAVLP
jgi:hypothetical protein